MVGNDRAVLFDTGATDDGSVRTAVDRVIASWLLANPRKDYERVVAHRHAHRDHIAGDASRLAGAPGVHPLGEGILSNGMGAGTNLRLIARSLGYLARRRLVGR